jgi:hypothetical protein
MSPGWSGGLALGTVDHPDPFQFSIKVVAANPVLSVVEPEAQQSELDTQVTAVR